MEKKNSVKVNYIFSLTYQILSIIAPIITTPYISRVLGPEGIGIYSYTNSIVTYFTIFGVLGLGTYGQLSIAKVKDDKAVRSQIFCNIECVRIILHLFCLIAYVGLICVVSENKNIYRIQIITVLASMLDVTWFFQGIEEFRDIAIKNIVIKLGTVIALLTLVKNNDLPIYVFINVSSLFISSVYFIPKVGRYIDWFKPKKNEIIKHVKNGFLYFIPTIASVIISMLDKTMLGIISHSDTQNGYYAEAYKIVFMAITVFSSLNMVMRSRMAYISVNGTENEIIIKKMKSSLRFVLLLAWPMTFGLCAIASNFVPIFLGESFRPSILLFEVMSWWIVFKATSNCILEQYILPILSIKKYAVVSWIGAFVDFVLNLFFIPQYRALGAVIASLLTELIVLIFVMFICREIVKCSDVIQIGWKYIISSLVMFASLMLIKQFVPDNIIMTGILILLGILIYIFMTIILKDVLVTTTIKELLNKIRSKA